MSTGKPTECEAQGCGGN